MINEVKSAQHAVIQSISGKQHAEVTEKSAQQAEQKAKQSSTSPRQEVNLTDTAAKLQSLEAQIANQPVVDTQRVESVKKAIANGSFKIDSNRIAEKMADIESLLASKATDK